jgi:hypothetical protein
MTPSEILTSLSTLDTIMSRMNIPTLDKELFRLTTHILMYGLKKPQADESILGDAVAHLEQARRLLGGQP